MRDGVLAATSTKLGSSSPRSLLSDTRRGLPASCAGTGTVALQPGHLYLRTPTAPRAEAAASPRQSSRCHSREGLRQAGALGTAWHRHGPFLGSLSTLCPIHVWGPSPTCFFFGQKPLLDHTVVVRVFIGLELCRGQNSLRDPGLQEEEQRRPGQAAAQGPWGSPGNDLSSLYPGPAAVALPV